MVERALQPQPHAVGGRRADGDAGGLEAFAVVALEHADQQIGQRMVAEVGRQVSHADAVVARMRGCGRQHVEQRRVPLRPRLRALQLVARRIGDGDEHEWRHHRLAGMHSRDDCCGLVREA